MILKHLRKPRDGTNEIRHGPDDNLTEVNKNLGNTKFGFSIYQKGSDSIRIHRNQDIQCCPLPVEQEYNTLWQR